MKLKRTYLLAAVLSSLMSLSHATPVPPSARVEIDALLAKLLSSACEFNRNGTWHTAAEARTHLLGKLDYLEGKNLVQSADQFIELGASTSSYSGKPYRVKCGNAAPVESRVWLSSELKVIRAAARPLVGMPR